MLTNKDRKYILNEFLNTIMGISDKEYQKRIWIRGEGPEWDNFDETVCHFFEIGDDILQNYNDFGITNDQYNILKKFRDEFKPFSRIHDYPEQFIDTPEWDKIVEMAKGVLKVFNYKKRSKILKRIDRILYRTKRTVQYLCRLCVPINKDHAMQSESHKMETIYPGNIPTFPRPEKISESFLVKITNRGVGMQYVNPENRRSYVRVMPGKPHSPLSHQREPYVIQMKDGKAFDKFGNLVPGFSPEAHIPIDEFVFKEEHVY